MPLNLKSSVIAVCLVSAIASQSIAAEFFLQDAGGPIAWPTSGGVVTGLDPNAFSQNERSGSEPWTLAQTFQVDTTFDLNSLFFVYRNKLPQGSPMQFQIFEVPDVNGITSLPATPNPSDIIFQDTFDAITSDNERVVAQLVLDSPLTLGATTGTAGYALRFIDSEPGEFRWYRTGSAANDIYAGGKAFEKFDEIGMRDFGLVLSDVGAPAPLLDAFSVQSGSLGAGSTWDTGAPPAFGTQYIVSDTHTVTVDSTAFAGAGVVVTSGGTLDLATSFANLKTIDVQAGGSLTTSMSGDIGIGDINATPLMKLNLDADIAITPSAGSDVFLDAQISGDGNIDVQSNGAASSLFITAANTHGGVIRYNGTGDEVLILEQQGFHVLEMNSTGANRVVFDPQTQLSNSALIFNQNGEVVHQSTNHIRQGVTNFTANANVDVDLSTAAVATPLRWRIVNTLSGTGDINVQGSSSAPAAMVDGPNEFEVGQAGEPGPGELRVDSYSGTFTASDYVDIEVFNSLPNARVVANANSTIEVGHRAIIAQHQIALGEVEIAGGGRLIVGFSEANESGEGRHNAHTLRVTSEGTRSGDLTTTGAATIVMQINGTGDGEFDRIIADGDVSLSGTLDLLVNPIATTGTDGENSIYAPMLGDTFELISLAPESPDGDYTGDGIVDDADYDAWVASYGSTTDLSADGNGDGIIDAADYTVWRDNEGSVGAIAGTLASSLTLNVIDVDGALAAAGLTFQLSSDSDSLQVEVVSATSFAVPEPSALAAVVLSIGGVLMMRRSV